MKYGEDNVCYDRFTIVGQESGTVWVELEMQSLPLFDFFTYAGRQKPLSTLGDANGNRFKVSFIDKLKNIAGLVNGHPMLHRAAAV